MKKIIFFLITVQLIYATDWHTITFDSKNNNVDEYKPKCIKDNEADPMNYFDKGYKITEKVNGNYNAEKNDLLVLITPTKNACEILRKKIIIGQRKVIDKAKQEERSYSSSSSNKKYITNIYDYSSSYANRDKIDNKGLKYSDGSSGYFVVKTSNMRGCIDLNVDSNSDIRGNGTSCDNAHNYWSYSSCGSSIKSSSGTYEDIVKRIVDECQ